MNSPSKRVLHTIFLGLGTNLGERAANLRAAIDALPPEVRVMTESPVYETAPWGYIDQPDFLNQVIQAETELSPRDLLQYLKKLEHDLGRQPTFRNGPRLIDLDILFYDDLVLSTKDLTVPHPLLHKRDFVLLPLADIAPELRHPVLGVQIKDLLKTKELE